MSIKKFNAEKLISAISLLNLVCEEEIPK